MAAVDGILSGVRRSLRPVLREFRRLPGSFGTNQYIKWIIEERERRAKDTEAAFDRIVAELDSRSVVLDCGANVGDVTARLAATGARVHAFEPEPYLFSMLCRRFADVPNVTLHNAAIAARGGTTSLWLETGEGREPSSFQSHSIVGGSKATSQGLRVEVACIDFFDFLSGLVPRPSLIKMDIEGAEVEILERMFAEGRVAEAVPMFVEMHERQIPSLRPRIVRLFREVAAQRSECINLFWP